MRDVIVQCRVEKCVAKALNEVAEANETSPSALIYDKIVNDVLKRGLKTGFKKLRRKIELAEAQNAKPGRKPGSDSKKGRKKKAARLSAGSIRFR